MRVSEIKRLVALVEESQIDELVVRRLWSTVRISKVRRENGGGEVQTVQTTVSHPMPVAVAEPPPVETPAPSPTPEPGPEPKTETEDGLVPIVSPMVGSFYSAASPTSPPYVEVGGRIQSGQVVCIIEAMKLMNEIEADISGTVVKILVENEQPVEFNQPLFLVRPDA